ncbi:chaplin [Streptomyces silvensis]|uniref:Chaplin n=1 Tax=Streptomyces silvensis TaxID=1765722 RepID=A0A0W7X3P1_9ACTN|nr:chaplin [Streptomyces silvensis]KUF17525.1 chaplin [Streptomyces silvensis]
MRKRAFFAAAALAATVVIGGAGAAAADPDPDAAAATTNNPGVISGNAVQIPVDLGVNACGLTVDVLGALNPATGNQCQNDQ